MINQASLISVDHSVISFYGTPSDKKSMSDFLEKTRDWFDELGYPPDKLAVSGSGHSGKPVSFSRASSKLKKNNFEEVNAFDIYSTFPEAKMFVRDYYLTASYSRRSGYASISAQSSIAKLDSSSMLPFAKELISTIDFQYGIGYIRPRHLGPAMYAIGIGQGLGSSGEEYEEKLNITRWGILGMKRSVYRMGLLRDVYPWNFLTAAQLEAPIENMTLQEWIQQQPNRGSLTSLSEKLILWEVEEDDITEIRSSLKEAKIIFDWRAYEREHKT